MPLGIFYRDKNRPTYEDNLDVYRHDKTPIVWRKRNLKDVEQKLLNFI
ncbi:MAG: hypothetical protein ACTSRW_10935 [Candidatus Helarchaeota archaeon]